MLVLFLCTFLLQAYTKLKTWLIESAVWPVSYWCRYQPCGSITSKLLCPFVWGTL